LFQAFEAASWSLPPPLAAAPHVDLVAAGLVPSLIVQLYRLQTPRALVASRMLSLRALSKALLHGPAPTTKAAAAPVDELLTKRRLISNA
jgi:hypothetical protein